MCCCCKCCNKVLKIICSIIWAIVVVALIIAIIIFAIAWGGSKVMQDVMSNLINCGVGKTTGTVCKESFGAYIERISTQRTLECIDVLQPNPFDGFGWLIDFKVADKGLGVFARMSTKGIKEEKEYIVDMSGRFGGSEDKFNLRIPPNVFDENDQVVEEEDKQFIIHDRYMRLNAIGKCQAATCPVPNNKEYSLVIELVAMHLRISFKSVPDFINLTFNEESFDYGEFVKVLKKIVKVFSKSAAESMESLMQTIQARVTDFQDGTLCPISVNYITPEPTEPKE